MIKKYILEVIIIMPTKDGSKKGNGTSGSRPVTTTRDHSKPLTEHGRITNSDKSNSPGHKGGKGNGR